MILFKTWQVSGINNFAHNIYPNVTSIVKLEFELAYFEYTVQDFSHCTKRNPTHRTVWWCSIRSPELWFRIMIETFVNKVAKAKCMKVMFSVYTRRVLVGFWVFFCFFFVVFFTYYLSEWRNSCHLHSSQWITFPADSQVHILYSSRRSSYIQSLLFSTTKRQLHLCVVYRVNKQVSFWLVVWLVGWLIVLFYSFRVIQRRIRSF